VTNSAPTNAPDVAVFGMYCGRFVRSSAKLGVNTAPFEDTDCARDGVSMIAPEREKMKNR